MKKMNILNPKLTIAWLYPEMMSTYGDRGNIIVLKKIAEDNNINIDILRVNHASDPGILKESDILFMGGAQDLQQEIVNTDLISSKGKVLLEMVENEIPGLYVCGAYQFLGNYYKDAYGTEIKGLGVFDMHTESHRTKPRLIGNIIISPTKPYLNPKSLFVGFENHGGRTYLKDKSQAFAKVIKGYGNNGEDGTEGIIYKNSIGTYLHGPILPSNPSLAIKILETALVKKYDKKVKLVFDDAISQKAKETILQRYS